MHGRESYSSLCKIRMADMTWRSIDSQSDLDAFNQQVYWDDSETLEYHATPENEPYFPADVSRSGFVHKNVRILCRINAGEVQNLEMVWIHCDSFTSRFLEHPFMSGRVDSLKRVEILDSKKSTQMRCARLIYRFVGDDVPE